jgi:hypothetical protein
MGLFNKKNCDICGGKIGILGNRKLDDGNLCGDCAKKLSPFFSDRRRSTVDTIREQLAYREANKAAVAAFRTTRTLGLGTKVLLDEDNGKFMVTKARRPEDENPDVLDFSQVTGCNIDVSESSKELKQKSPDGQMKSFVPPRHEYEYDFNCIIHVNHPWFNEISFKVNSSTIKVQKIGPRAVSVGGPEIGRTSHDYREAEALGQEIRTALTQVRKEVRANVAAANKPKTAQTCPLCGATTTPDERGLCEYCGGAMAS